MPKKTINLRKAFVIIASFLVFGIYNNALADELKVSEQGSGYQTAESPADSVQPAEDVIYGERLRTDSSISVGSTGYFYQGFHTRGVIFANNTIVNNTLDPNREAGTPVTIGDELRIDGEIWRGTSKGTSDDMPLKISDTLMPTITNTNDVGTVSNYWRNGYFSGDVAVGNLIGTGVVNPINLAVSSAATIGQVLSINADGNFEWVTIGSGGIGDITTVTAGTGITVSGGTSGDATVALNTTYTDNRYVNIAGDTMTGALTVNNQLVVSGQADFGGGFSDTGVSIYDTGGINAAGALSASSLTTGGMLTVGGVAGISGNVLIGGGYTASGGSGVAIYDTGALSMNGELNIAAGYSPPVSAGGLFAVTAAGVTIGTDGDIKTNTDLLVDGKSEFGGGYDDDITPINGGATIYNDGMIISQGSYGTSTTLEASGAATEFLWYPQKAAFRAGRVTSDHWDDSNIGNYSLATGYNTTASGTYSVATGNTATASSTGSIAMGLGAQAVGNYSVSVGSSNIATGANSVAMGYRAKADADADQSFVWAGDSACTTDSDSCDIDQDHIFAIIGGLCVDDEGGDDCPEVVGGYDGDIVYDGSSSAYDLAEGFPTDRKLDKGDVVIATHDTKIGYTNKQFDSRVLGVISTSPNIAFNFDGQSNSFSRLGGLDYEMQDNIAPLTLSGRIPTKATNENGNIEIGDLLTTSSKEGYAMKYSLLNPEDAENFEELKSILKENENRRNSILGKALEPCNEDECKIVTLLSLQ